MLLVTASVALFKPMYPSLVEYFSSSPTDVPNHSTCDESSIHSTCPNHWTLGSGGGISSTAMPFTPTNVPCSTKPISWGSKLRTSQLAASQTTLIVGIE